jgi:hypothetical protein
MSDAEFLGKLCGSLLGIPQVSGVSIDIRGGWVDIKYRVYGVFEGVFGFTEEDMRNLDPDAMIDYMVSKARHYISDSGIEQEEQP